MDGFGLMMKRWRYCWYEATVSCAPCPVCLLPPPNLHFRLTPYRIGTITLGLGELRHEVGILLDPISQYVFNKMPVTNAFSQYRNMTLSYHSLPVAAFTSFPNERLGSCVLRSV